MIRRVGHALSAMSLLLCLAAMAMWVRSYIWSDQFAWGWVRADGQPVAYALESRCGRWCFWVKHGGFPIDRMYTVQAVGRGDTWSWLTVAFDADHVQFLGFEWWEGSLHMPSWFVTICTAVLPLAWGIRLCRRRVRQSGFCAACGYDLRASPDRCPECGECRVSRRAP